MSAKAISEQTGKEFLYKYISTSAAIQNRFRYANVTAETDFDRLAKEQPWLLTEVRWKDHRGVKARPFLDVLDGYNLQLKLMLSCLVHLFGWS